MDRDLIVSLNRPAVVCSPLPLPERNPVHPQLHSLHRPSVRQHASTSASASSRQRQIRTRKRSILCSAAGVSEKSAKKAVEDGLRNFEKKQYGEALELFEAALSNAPRPEEAQAALYNSACCHTKLKQWQPAAEAIAEAVNSYNLRLKVALEVCSPSFCPSCIS